MTEAFNRKTSASLIPRQIMLGAAFSKEDRIKDSKGKKMDETMAAVVGIEDMKKRKKEKKEKKKSSYKMSNTVEMCPELADIRAMDYSNDDVLPLKGNRRDDLLRSIDAFLESSGFVKTLSVFRSEAQIEVTKSGSFINLEDLFETFSWPSKRDYVANIDWSKEQDTGKFIPEVANDSDVKTKNKKRKIKEAFGSFELENAEKNHLGASLLATQLSRKLMKKEKHSGEDESGPRSGAKAQEVLGHVRGSKKELVAKIEWTKERGKFIKDTVDDSDVKTKDKKRKNNQVFGSFELGNPKKNAKGAALRPEDSDFENRLVNKDTALDEEDAAKENFDELQDLNNNPILENDSAVKNKSEKKRKKKEAKPPLEQFRHGDSQEAFAKEPDDGKGFASIQRQESVNSDKMKNVGNFEKDKRKTKNKLKEVTTSYSLHTDSSYKVVDETCGGVQQVDNGSLQKIDFVKDSIAISKENASDGETRTNKKKKRSSTNETEKHFEIIAAANNSKHAKLEVTKEGKEIMDQKILYCSDSLPLKQKSNEPSKELFICLDKHEENSALQDSLKQLNGYHSGNMIIENYANEGSAMPNSMKKERHSGEQRGLNAFQRVKVDEIKFADERLQDNSYWALDETGSGYGAKAQEVLGQVRGRNFRHEKTKKKRGTYRGGQIDLQSHSIKFNYSDDDC